MTANIKGILAGILISIGCVINLSVSVPIVGSVLFALGLYTIVIFGLNLYTGKAGYLVTVYNKPKYLFTLFEIFFSNFIGCVIAAVCIGITRINISATQIMITKMNDSCWSLFILGIFCGMLMHIAVKGYKKTKNPLIVIFPVAVFILSGFEHCIADLFYYIYSLPSIFKLGYGYIDSLLMIGKIVLIALGNLLGGMTIEYVTELKNEY